MGSWLAGRRAMPPILDGAELLRPWKLFTFAVGLALMLVGSVYYRISDWDFGICFVIPPLTYLTAPWVVRVIAGGHLRHLPLALFWTWFTVDGSYWFYHTQIGNEMLRRENLLTSTPIYLAMGCFWLPRLSLREMWRTLLGRGQAMPHYQPVSARAPRRPPGLLATLLTFGLAVSFWALLVEPFLIEVSVHRIGQPRADRQVVRVVQLSDLHVSRLGWREAAVARRVAALRPDLIVLTGDNQERADELPEAETFIGRLPKVPVVAVLGNWEHWAGLDPAQLAKRAEKIGVRLLINESALLNTAQGPIRLTGLDDATSGTPDWVAATRGIKATERVPHLVLQHSPAYRETLHEQMAAGRGPRPLAMLSGHTHGGQIDLFGWRPMLPPGSGAYVAGWYREGGGRNAVPMYVSRGIGVSVLPLRFGARPEIAVFEVGR